MNLLLKQYTFKHLVQRPKQGFQYLHEQLFGILMENTLVFYHKQSANIVNPLQFHKLITAVYLRALVIISDTGYGKTLVCLQKDNCSQ